MRDLNRIVQHLLDAETPLEVALLYGLSDLDEQELEKFRHIWPHLPTERRRQVVGFLLDIAESNLEVDFGEVFGACMDDPDEEVRAWSVEGLWESEDDSLITAFLKMVRTDPSARVRAAAVGALDSFVLLGELGRIPADYQREMEEVLLTLFRSPHENIEVRRRAVESLACSSDPRVFEVIEEAYGHADRLMRVAAVFAMGRSLDRRWEVLLLDELRSHDPEMRYEAARSCGELELASAVPLLSDLLSDQDREVQEAGIWALGQIGGQRAREILQAHYESVDPNDEALRDAVEEALGELALSDGAVQFSLYEYDVEDVDEVGMWDQDWLDGVLDDLTDNGFDDEF